MLKKNAEGVEVEVADTQVDETINQEQVNEVVANAVENAGETIADNVVNKMLKKMATSEAKVTEKTVERGSETRSFLKALVARDTEYLKALKTTSDADGGYLVPKELLNEVIRIAAEGYGVARAEMRYLPFGGAGNSRIIPKLASSVAVFWTEEGGKKQGTKATFGVITQTLKKLAAIVPLTEELVEDTDIDVVKLVAELFVEACSIEEDLQFFTGDGTVWTGLLNTTAIADLAIKTGAAFDKVTADDLLALQSKVARGARRNGKYFMHTSIIDVVRSLKDTNGQYIYKDAPTSGGISTIWGKPVVEVEAMPGVDTPSQASKHFVIFGDMKLGAIYGDKKDMRVKLLDQATIVDADGTTNINLAQEDMIGVRVVKRVGYVVANEKALARLKTKAS